MKEEYFEKAIAWTQRKSSSEIKANFEGFEKPRSFKNRNSNTEETPDLSYESHGALNFVEIAVKTSDVQPLITRWKLLSIMASMKHGKLYILTPKGHKMFAENIVKDYNISAKIQSL